MNREISVALGLGAQGLGLIPAARRRWQYLMATADARMPAPLRAAGCSTRPAGTISGPKEYVERLPDD
jgi:hypothetical protein